MKYSLLSFSLLILCQQANAAIVAITNLVGFDNTTNAFVNASGAVVPNATGFVSAGIFSTLSDTDITNATSMATLAADWVSVTSGNFNSGDGLFDIPQGSNAAVTGGTAYAVIGNGATFAASTQIFIARSNVTFLPSPSISTKLVVSTSPSGNVNTINILKGGHNNFSYNFGAGSFPAYNLVTVIPEPSAALLAAFGSLALLRRRRN